MQKEEQKIETDEEYLARIKIKPQKKGWEKIEIPGRWVDGNFPFNFTTFVDKNIGIIFFVTGLVIPFLGGLTLKLAFSLTSDFSDSLVLANMAISIISNGIGFFIIWDKRRTKMFNTTLFIFYIYSILPLLLSLLISPVQLINVGEGWKQSMQMIFQTIVYLCLAMWVFKRVPDLKSRFFKTIKQNWRMILLIAFIGAAILLAKSFIYEVIMKALDISEGNSNNQESLVSPLLSGSLGSKIFYAISLFFFTVIAAPLIEELVFRDAVFVGTSNRWLGWVMSSILFGYIHVSWTGDFAHLVDYFLAGLVLATVFNICRGNVTYSWAVHSLSNFIAYIFIIVGAFSGNN